MQEKLTSKCPPYWQPCTKPVLVCALLISRLADEGQLMRRFVPLLIGCLAILFTVACGAILPPVTFTSDRDGNLEIYAAKPGDAERNLTNSIVPQYSPIVSPNGQLVAFLSRIGEDVLIDAMRIDGSGLQQLSPRTGKYTNPKWSPDSMRITYVSIQDSNPMIYVTSLDDSDPVLLTSISASDVGGWSPDGKSIVFAVNRGSEQGIYSRNPDGVNEFRLTDTEDYSPRWSPVDDQIAFLSMRDGNPEIYVMNVDGTEQKRLTDNMSVESQISWSPDGQQALYVSEVDGNPEIYIVDIKTGDQSRLTVNKFIDERPTWSPNGDKIAFVSYQGGDAEIFIMDATGDNQNRLTNNTFQDTDPSW